MNELTTPGKRLRYFCKTFFSSVTVFAHEMGFSKPGSLYDYFNDTKKPGGLLLDKLRILGGNPIWLRYGTGSMFAENEAGRERSIEYRNKFPYEPIPEQIASAEDSQVQEPQPPYAPNTEVLMPATPAEMLYLHLGAVQFRLHASDSLPNNVVQLYRNLTEGISKELDRLERKSEQDAIQ